MSHTDKNIYCTTFLGDDIVEVLRDASIWLNMEVKLSKLETVYRKYSFYFSQLVQSYDSETGYCIDIYHEEIK